MRPQYSLYACTLFCIIKLNYQYHIYQFIKIVNVHLVRSKKSRFIMQFETSNTCYNCFKVAKLQLIVFCLLHCIQCALAVVHYTKSILIGAFNHITGRPHILMVVHHTTTILRGALIVIQISTLPIYSPDWIIIQQSLQNSDHCFPLTGFTEHE